MQAIQSLNVNIPMQFVSVIDNFRNYGFKDYNELISYALQLFVKERNEKDLLIQSADLYANIYKEDEELRHLTEVSIIDWE